MKAIRTLFPHIQHLYLLTFLSTSRVMIINHILRLLSRHILHPNANIVTAWLLYSVNYCSTLERASTKNTFGGAIWIFGI